MKKIYILGLIIMLVFGTVSVVGANNVELTPRALGMGGAFTAVANDITTVIYNPAGLTDIGALGVYTSLGTAGLEEFSDMADFVDGLLDESGNLENILEFIAEDTTLNSQLLTGVNLGNFVLAINSYNQLQQTGNTLDSVLQAEGILGFGEKFTAPFFNLGAIHYGVNLKMLYTEEKSYNIGDWERTSLMTGTGFGVDTGLLIKMTDLFKVGMQVNNIFAPEYEITGQDLNTGDSLEKIITPCRTMRLGAALRIPLLGATLAADVSNISLGDNGEELEPTIHLGVEKNLLFNLISLRGGTYQRPDDTQMYTLGLGLRFLMANVNASFAASENFTEEQMVTVSGAIRF